MSSPTTFRCYVMGSESLLVQCSEILLQRGHPILGVVSAATEIVRWAQGRGLRVIAPGEGLADRIGDDPFELFFSIANLSIIPDAVLAKPSRGTINFHDGPLPRYAGLNATSWALMGGERTHGVSWHFVEGGVDEGRILEQRVFELADNETALTLNTRCYELGIETFERLVDALERGEERPRPQDLNQRSYYGRYDRPPAACAIDWNEPAHRIDALVRALDYGRYPNPLGEPKVVLEKSVVFLPQAERGDDSVSQPPGTVLAFDENGLEVATATGSLVFPRVLEPGGPIGAERARELGLIEGATLAMPESERERLSALDRELARHETFWAERLRQVEPARIASTERSAAERGVAINRGVWGGFPPRMIAQTERTIGSRIERRAVEADAEPADLLAALAAWYFRVSGKTSFDFAYRTAVHVAYATHVPLRMTVDRDEPFSSLRDKAQAELARIAERCTYLCDLVLRRPGIAAPEWDIAFERTTSLDGSVLPAGASAALVTDGARAAFLFDADRLKDGDEVRRRLEVLLRAAREAPSTKIADLPMLSADERERILQTWNATARAYPSERCVHELFEAQADRTPDATAIVYRGTSLSYRELDQRANQLAHRLIELGVRADTPVGLCTDRSLELAIGALGILKAGGAYVPLDPSYPPERIAFMQEDCSAPIVVARSGIDVPGDAQLVVVDAQCELRHSERPQARVQSTNLAYLIYTSGSTGTPKGVMVEHKNVANFFTGMDAVVDHDPPGTWLAVTSLSFDISVLELFWTLARGFTIVIASDEDRSIGIASEAKRSEVSGGASSGRSVEFSLFYFASDEGEHAADKYRLLLEGARFADAHGFCAVWTPERHFHAFGGLYPNPAVASAALAVITERVHLRAGSCVSPLHHPIRVAEEWALVDNLSKGRVGISFASGWQPNDFVLRPEAFANNKKQMIEDIDVIRRLWRGEKLPFDGPNGTVEVGTLPRPISPELPFWITAAGSPETFEIAGRLGGGILTHLLGQTHKEVEEKIRVYREAWRAAGHAGDGHVTLMLHTFVGPDASTVKETVREPMKSYLRSSMMLIQQHAWSFPAFKRHAREGASFKDNFQSLSPEDTEALLDHSFERYYETSGLFGTKESCLATVEACRAIGVDEIACLIDYGVDSQTVLAHLPYLDELRRLASAPRTDDHSIAAELGRHRVTHMQCTPSMARVLVANDEAKSALRGLRHLLVGGEALPASLARELRAATDARITNMYGPTETTIWSSTHEVGHESGATVSIGRPIANTQLYVLDPSGNPVPVGVTGELYIGGAGVARGYFRREELTSERFVPDPFARGGRLYRTGDEARWTSDGRVEFLGRVDHQVKIRGYRVELGEIESLLSAHASVREAVVIAREDTPGDQRLVAYVHPKDGAFDPNVLKSHLRERLPEFMVPAHVVRMDRFPLTPNKKIDRRALPRPEVRAEGSAHAPKNPVEETIATIWKRILGLDSVGTRDNFFELGGHSLLAVQAHREIKEATGCEVTVTDIFRYPTIAALAAHLEGGGAANATIQRSVERAALRRQASAGTRRVARRR